MHLSRAEAAGPSTPLLDADGRAVAAYVRSERGARLRAAAFRLVAPVDGPTLVALVRRDLAGSLLVTEDPAAEAALVAGGLPTERDSSDLVHDLRALPPAPRVPAGWSLDPVAWDDGLPALIAAAYAPPHPDAARAVAEQESLRGQLLLGVPAPALAPAGALIRTDAGAVHGLIITMHPVPWTGDSTAWIGDVAVHPAARGRGLGRVLLAHALRGAAGAGMTEVGLSVTAGNPARRLYESAGFRPVRRQVGFRVP